MYAYSVTVIKGAMDSTVFFPMPETRVSSEISENGPFCVRYSIILTAFFSPIPLSVISTALSAVLIFISVPEDPPEPELSVFSLVSVTAAAFSEETSEKDSAGKLSSVIIVTASGISLSFTVF